jgi:hypothetical protein
MRGFVNLYCERLRMAEGQLRRMGVLFRSRESGPQPSSGSSARMFGCRILRWNLFPSMEGIHDPNI